MAYSTTQEDYVEVTHCDTAMDFLDYLQLRHPRWLESDAWESNWAFRGQRNAEWQLVPSAMRTDWFQEFKRESYNEINQIIEEQYDQIKFLPNEFKPNKQLLKDLLAQVCAEWYAVEKFVSLADHIGHSIPEDRRIGRGEYTIPATLREILIGNSQKPYDYSFSPALIEFALAQHHGIPTRGLDWTSIAFVASYFAAEDVIKCSDEKSYSLAVWAIDRSKLENTDLEVATQRRWKIDYLRAQGGLFIYDTMANKHFLVTGEWRPLEQATFEKGILRKVTLPAQQAGDLIRLLSAENISRAQLMPTYDNITETLRLKKLIKEQ